MWRNSEILQANLQRNSTLSFENPSLGTSGLSPETSIEENGGSDTGIIVPASEAVVADIASQEKRCSDRVVELPPTCAIPSQLFGW